MTLRIDPTRALPLQAYRDADVFEHERHTIWRGGWVFVGTVDQVAEPGDWFATELGGQPIIVRRDQQGELGALANVCAHRGTLLVEGAGNDKRFQCPYHSWTYRDDGSLMAVPHSGDDDIDKADWCLPRYRCEAWNGLVFVSINEKVSSLAERFAHLDPIVAPHGIESLHHWTSQRESETWAANWKLVMANAMESYHLFAIHPDTLEPYTPTSGSYYIAGNAHGTATGGQEKGQDDYVLLSLPPNFVGVISNNAFLYQVVVPVAADRTTVVSGGAFAETDPATSSAVGSFLKRTAARVSESLVPDFLPEDKAICERGQLAASGDFEPGPILGVERVLVDFHTYLAEAYARESAG